MLGGMVWAAVPAVLKVKTGAHEVVTTIMMNGIAVSFVGLGAQRAAEVRRATGGAFNVEPAHGHVLRRTR